MIRMYNDINESELSEQKKVNTQGKLNAYRRVEKGGSGSK